MVRGMYVYWYMHISYSFVQLDGGCHNFQVRPINKNGFITYAFFIVRPNGEAEDFSTRKCVANLFPAFAANMEVCFYPCFERNTAAAALILGGLKF